MKPLKNWLADHIITLTIYLILGVMFIVSTSMGTDNNKQRIKENAVAILEQSKKAQESAIIVTKDIAEIKTTQEFIQKDIGKLENNSQAIRKDINEILKRLPH